MLSGQILPTIKFQSCSAICLILSSCRYRSTVEPIFCKGTVCTKTLSHPCIENFQFCLCVEQVAFLKTWTWGMEKEGSPLSSLCTLVALGEQIEWAVPSLFNDFPTRTCIPSTKAVHYSSTEKTKNIFSPSFLSLTQAVCKKEQQQDASCIWYRRSVWKQAIQLSLRSWPMPQNLRSSCWWL